MGVSIIGKSRNGSPPTPAMAFEFHPRERRKSTARIARAAAIPRASRRPFKAIFIAEVRDTFYTLDGPGQARSAARRGRILIHPLSLKWPLSLRGTSGERAGEHCH